MERVLWWGGFYERMIGLMKWRLKKMIGRVFLNVVEFVIMFIEIEVILNSWFFIYIYGDIDDGLFLMLLYFLCGYRLLVFFCLELIEEDFEYVLNDLMLNEFIKKFRYY